MALDYTQEIEARKKFVIYANEKAIYYNNLYDNTISKRILLTVASYELYYFKEG